MTDTNPYHEALTMILQNHGTGGAGSMAKLVLSLYNDQCGFAFSECVGNLDRANTALAVRMVQHFAERGETQELRDVGKQLADKHYPGLWEMGNVMGEARAALREKWRQDERKAELDALDAAEAALFSDPAKMIPVSTAKGLLEQGDPQKVYAYFNSAGDWRDKTLARTAVHTAIEAIGGAELSYNCPDIGQALAVRMEDRIYYVCTDYDARQAYLETIQPPKKSIPTTISVPPRGQF